MNQYADQSVVLNDREMAVACANLRMMRFLDRLAARFNGAGVDLMVLKGAALLLSTYDQPHRRSSCDLDLLVRPDQIDRAFDLLAEHGCRRSQHLVRDDFFPRFYYEVEFEAGTILPLTIDLHIRPFRPLRYTRLVPDDLLWRDARSVGLGRGRVFVPGHEDMLLHLAVHYAIHGGGENKWARDIRLWTRRFVDCIDWSKLNRTAARWRLNWPLRRGLEMAGLQHTACWPSDAREQLAAMPVNWRDRLALAQAPHDNLRPWRHVFVEAITTPGAGFVARYLAAALLPDRRHMRQWYGQEHRGWLLAAHLARWTKPLINLLQPRRAETV